MYVSNVEYHRSTTKHTCLMQIGGFNPINASGFKATNNWICLGIEKNIFHTVIQLLIFQLDRIITVLIVPDSLLESL